MISVVVAVDGEVLVVRLLLLGLDLQGGGQASEGGVAGGQVRPKSGQHRKHALHCAVVDIVNTPNLSSKIN